MNEFADLIKDAKEYGNIKAALRTKVNNAQNEANGYKAQQMANNIDGYSSQTQKVDLEMSVSEADRIINTYLDKEKEEEEQE